MGYSRDEQLDLLREAILDLARASAVDPNPTNYPGLARLLLFDQEIRTNLAAAAAEDRRRAEQEAEIPPIYGLGMTSQPRNGFGQPVDANGRPWWGPVGAPRR